ncbi:cation diffusion facilitator family transporter [Janibacter sp. GXQ6167]|uniref:cation diffusion facilitator family transporter n=1 Tax=Janibacter sp. GXQ6167 TaxID=3240791 RepID=UPI0035267A74
MPLVSASEKYAARRNLQKYAWLAIAAALMTIGLKTGAWLVTGSVGLLSDAAESVVNLVAAIAALIALRVAATPADDGHQFGHTKAEYFSAAIEGTMIFVAALVILWQSVLRLINPQPLENVGIGLGISVLASVINGAVAILLLRAGKRYRSITLTADGKHLMTDVWTSIGVVVGVLLVAVTGIDRLDPIVAIAVAINILFAGYQLLNASSRGLMDGTMSDDDNAKIAGIVRGFRTEVVDFHALRTRMAGHRGFAEMHVLVPGEWSVQRGHDLVEDVEEALLQEFPDLHIMAHLEPREDPRAYGDYESEIPIDTELVGEPRSTDVLGSE